MKDLPYFKFYVNEWLTGDISVEPYEAQGVFVNICSLYWSKEGNLSEDFVLKKFKGTTEIITALFDAEVLSSEGGYIVIDFLDEQMDDRKRIAKRNRINGKKGGRPPKPKPTPQAAVNPVGLVSESEAKAKKSNIEEKRREEKREEENLKSSNEQKKIVKSKRFIKPTPEEIQAYCTERKNNLSGQQIFDHYEANGWKRGKTAIKDWKACVRTWEQNRTTNATTRPNSKNSAAADHHRVQKTGNFGYGG